ncbi:hypothetical protein pb186bvf_004001 [Paramecium bursaria]
MLKYVQDLDFGIIQPLAGRQKKLINLEIPSQQLIKNRSVSQVLHQQLLQMQKSSSRNNSKQRGSSKIKHISKIEQDSPLQLPKIQNESSIVSTTTSPKKPPKIIKKESFDNSNWSPQYLLERTQSPNQKDQSKILSEQLLEKKLISLTQIKQSESPKKTNNSSFERMIRFILAESIINQHISLTDLIPEDFRQVNDVDDMLEQCTNNIEQLRQMYQQDRLINKILIKIQGIRKKIIQTFFKEIKPNCPNDINLFEQYYKLRKHISKDLIIGKFIVGFEPDNDLIIRKLLLNSGDSPLQLNPRRHINDHDENMYQKVKSLSMRDLLNQAKTLKFDFDFFNKLNYYNNNLKDYIQQKQFKALQTKIQYSNNIDSSYITLDFEQPESLVQKLQDCEKRLGKFSKITSQERFKYIEAEAYLYYR